MYHTYFSSLDRASENSGAFTATDPYASAPAQSSGVCACTLCTDGSSVVESARPDDYVLSDTKWGSSRTLGTSGGTVTWSIVGAGLTNQTGQTYFTGSTVDFSSILTFDYVSVLTQAFASWSAQANINFVQVADGGGNMGVGLNANIRVSAGFIDGAPAGSNVLARAFYPAGGVDPKDYAASGDIVFDSGQGSFWTQSSFLAVAAHEIGHSLGLNHTSVSNSLMNPSYNPAITGPQADDIAGIRAIYGTQAANTAPVATINDRSLAANEWSKVNGWISYTDAENNPATKYEFWDGGTGATSGYFWTSSNPKHAANTTIAVNAADLGDVWVRGGQVGGSETMWVRAFDGTSWSAWDTFTLSTVPPKPVATIEDRTLGRNEWSTVASWITKSGGAATQYQFWDSGTGADSGYFWTPSNPKHAANTAITVSAADLANVWVRGGSAVGSETMWVRAYDGTQWGDWDAFTFTTNTPPVATISDRSLGRNEWSTVASWINYNDADGQAATKYEFWDSGTAANSAYFWTPSNPKHAANTTISVTAADLGNVWVRGGDAAGSESLWVRAFDGTSWSAWDPFSMTTLLV